MLPPPGYRVPSRRNGKTWLLLPSWRGVRLRKGKGSVLRWTIEPFVRLRLMWRGWTFVIAFALLSSTPAVAVSEYQAQVVSVLDGDTLEVLNEHHADCIRLSGIDCPEKGQAFGKRAKQDASALTLGKEVVIQTSGTNKYNRILGNVTLPDGGPTSIRYAPGGVGRENRKGQCVPLVHA